MCVFVGVLLFLLQLVSPPAHDFYIQLFQPLPHIPTRPAGIAEGSEAAPAKGEDAIEGEVVDGEVSEKRYVCMLERKAEGEEAMKRIMIRGDEV